MTSRLKSAAGAVLSGASRMEKRSETRKNWRESLCMKYLLVSYLKHLYTPDLRVSMILYGVLLTMSHGPLPCGSCGSNGLWRTNQEYIPRPAPELGILS